MSLSDDARRIMRERGINPADHPIPTFDPIAWRVERQQAAIARSVPARFVNATPDDEPQIAGWVDRFVADPAGAPSILIAGPTGSGKTWLAFGALRAAVLRLAEKGQSIDWRHTTQPELNDELRPQPDGSHRHALDRFLAAGLLILDDLGAGKQSEWTGDGLYRLVDHRWSHNLPTIYTTNLTSRELERTVGDRIVSRISDSTRIGIRGHDRRRSAR